MSATRAVLGILLIPFATVSGVALLGDAASSTDPGRVGWGLLALAAGSVGGLTIVVVARATAEGLSTVAALLATHRDPTLVLPVRVTRPFVPILAAAQSRDIAIAPISRRGPPSVSG